MMLATLALAGQISNPSTVHMTIHADQPTVRVSPSMYGIFFEEINQAGEGGLYAELLRTRGMEGATPGYLPIGWYKSGDVAFDPDVKLDPARPGSLRFTQTASAPCAAFNEGFWGISVRAGEAYRLVIWAKGDAPLEASLQTGGGKSLAKESIAPAADWKRFTVTLKPTATTPNASLKFAPTKPGTVWLGYASLMPEKTWKSRDNGLRPDLATHIEEMRPGFVRFPGGCFVEGRVLSQAFDWKKSIGPMEQRDPMGCFWGYPASNGLGYHEYLQWCEDLGASALFVANCGMSHEEVAPIDKMDRYVQDTLDAIEYANGPATSKWGAVRAKNGHPKPFNLRYVEIGNENGGPAYDERYALIARAIHDRYPDIELIACVWGGTPKSYPLQLIDEHYYNSPAFFWRQMHRYDSYDRKGPGIYVGEYAVTRGCGDGNLDAALGEAAFMTGMERNADVVKMASYAPLFANVNNRQWNPNAIVFDNSRSYGTPSYWVQWLFANNRPDQVLKYEVDAPATPPKPLSGGIGFQTWRTQAEFRDIAFEADGSVVFGASGLALADLENVSGEWSFDDGAARQGSLEENRRAMLRGIRIPKAKKLTLRLKARKLGGDEGFIIMMGVSPERELQWNLGGWGNTVHAFQSNSDRFGRGVTGKIETGRWYDIRIEREGNVTRGYLDGKLIEEVEDEPTPDFAAVAGHRGEEIIVKAVNGASVSRQLDLTIDGAKTNGRVEGWIMTSKNLADENSLDHPNRIRPKRFTADAKKIVLPPYSVVVLKLGKQKERRL